MRTAAALSVAAVVYMIVSLVSMSLISVKVLNNERNPINFEQHSSNSHKMPLVSNATKAATPRDKGWNKTRIRNAVLYNTNESRKKLLSSAAVRKDTASNNTRTANTAKGPSKVAHGRTFSRFPAYGTREFQQKCPWAIESSPSIANKTCIFLVRPTPNDKEGVSLWVSLITQAHQLAIHYDCHLVFDYGENINVSSILAPVSSWNWTVPNGFQCDNGRSTLQTQPHYNCHHWKSPSHAPRVSVEAIAKQQNKTVVSVPLYRYGYKMSQYPKPRLRLKRPEFEDFIREIPSFQPELGMACSMNSLIHLSPDSSRYMPSLFTEILPTLRDDKTLVIALYIRTLQADKAVDKEKNGDINPFVEESDYRNQSMDILDCAMQQEADILNTTSQYSSTIWSVFSDSKRLKQWIAETYATDKRRILITDSRGAHTRSDHGVDQVDFAEAMIDWFLIGESDLVIMNRHAVSYGGTAALRTARPVYDASYMGQCRRAITIHDS